MVESLIEHHLKCYDVQTVATLLCLLDPPIREKAVPVIEEITPQRDAPVTPPKEPQARKITMRSTSIQPARKSNTDFNPDQSFLSVRICRKRFNDAYDRIDWCIYFIYFFYLHIFQHKKPVAPMSETRPSIGSVKRNHSSRSECDFGMKHYTDTARDVAMEAVAFG